MATLRQRQCGGMTSSPSQPSRTTSRRSRTSQAAALDAIALGSPDALVSALPFLLGFPPRESVILVWLRQRAILLTQRLDLPAHVSDLPAWMTAAWSHAGAADGEEVIVVVATADWSDIARAVVTGFLSEADERAMPVRDALRLDGDRWWSLLCTDNDCCPADGRTVDHAVMARVAAEFTVLGIAPLPDRDAVVASLGPDRPRVVDVATRISGLPAPTSLERESWRDDALDRLGHRICGGRGAGSGTATDDAFLLHALADIRVRDTLLWDLTALPTDALALALDRLITLLRAAPVGHVAPVATCVAVVAWLLGDGARALIATERAREDDPGYSLAALVTAALEAGLPPGTYRQAVGRPDPRGSADTGSHLAGDGGTGIFLRRSRVPALSSGLLDGNPPPRWGAPDEDRARSSGKRGSCTGQDPGDTARSTCAVVVECRAAESRRLTATPQRTPARIDRAPVPPRHRRTPIHWPHRPPPTGGYSRRRS